MSCGNCKHWESHNEKDEYDRPTWNSRGTCRFPLPLILIQQINNWNAETRSLDGFDCATFEDNTPTRNREGETQ